MAECDKDAAKLEELRQKMNTALKYNSGLSAQNKIKALIKSVEYEQAAIKYRRQDFNKNESARAALVDANVKLGQWVEATYQIKFFDYYKSNISFPVSAKHLEDFQSHNEWYRQFFASEAAASALKSSAIKSIHLESCWSQNDHELLADGDLTICDTQPAQSLIKVFIAQVSAREVAELNAQNVELASSKNISVDCLFGLPAKMRTCKSEVNTVYDLRDKLNKRTTPASVYGVAAKCHSEVYTFTAPPSMAIDLPGYDHEAVVNCINGVGNP